MMQWFFESLAKQVLPGMEIQVVVVDYWRNALKEFVGMSSPAPEITVDWVAPLPSFCQGEHRLTKENYFDASIARNTGFVYAKYDYVAFVDDVSVLMPYWLSAVLEGQREQQIVLGSYQKHSKMEVKQGELVSSEVQEHDKDSRLKLIGGYHKVKGHASWFYGCSFAMPLEAALQVNGFDEMCAITGYEDCNFGLRLEKAGYKFWYDIAMSTVESIEHHSTDVVMKRIDPEVTQAQYYDLMDKYGLEPRLGRPVYPRYDASHFELDVVKFTGTSLSAFNGFDLRKLREKALKGEEITVKDMNFPERFWFTGELLSTI